MQLNWTLLAKQTIPSDTRPIMSTAKKKVNSKVTTPAFGLYGEPPRNNPFFIHVESIQERSNAYNWEIQTHIHKNMHQAIWLKSGQISTRINGLNIEVKAPAAVIVPSLTSHSFTTNDHSLGNVLTVNRDFFTSPESKTLGNIFETLFEKPSVCNFSQSAQESDSIDMLFKILEKELLSNPTEDLLTKRLTQSIALLLARQPKNHIHLTKKTIASDKKISEFLLAVEKYFSSEITLSEYADRLEISTDKLIRMARLHLDKTPIQIVIDRRLKEACQLLMHTHAPIDEVSSLSGFSDVSYFCRQFKKRTGLTPLSFRKNAHTVTPS